MTRFVQAQTDGELFWKISEGASHAGLEEHLREGAMEPGHYIRALAAKEVAADGTTIAGTRSRGRPTRSCPDL